jgi:hypothetical protein
MEIVAQQFQYGSGFQSLKSNALSSSQFTTQNQVYDNQTVIQSSSSDGLSWPPETQKSSEESQDPRLNIYKNDGAFVGTEPARLSAETASLAIEQQQLYIVFKDEDGKITNTIPPTKYDSQSRYNGSLLDAETKVDLYV